MTTDAESTDAQTTHAAATEIATTDGGWEIVIGLECHAELATKTKLFSGAPNEFGAAPNTNIDPVTLGLPGSLPVLNERAVELAIRVGLALNCRIQPCVFARKNYFYPDMPKDFQITQFDKPLNEDGWLDLPDGTRLGIERAHIEEDTGKSTHIGGGGRIHEAGHSLVDYNRAGIPLVEIVGHPDIRSSEQAKAYAEELRTILVTIGASDGKMEEGSFRVDANISIRRPGDPLGTRCEVKNVNSLRSLGRAIDYEAARQIDMIEAGEKVRQETRHWNESDGRTHTLRVKEEADDYRYFPEPDLVPIVPDEAWIAQIRAAMPSLPAARRQALADAAGVPTPDAAIAVERGLDELALAAISAGADASRVLTHIENNLAVEGAATLDAGAFAKLVQMETSGQLTATQTKQVLAEMAESGGDPEAIASSRGFEAMDSDDLESLVDKIIAENAQTWTEYCDGDTKKLGFFVGQVMKATNGQADGKVVNRLFAERVERG